MLCPPFFLIVIGEVKIRTTNPQFFYQCEKFSFRCKIKKIKVPGQVSFLKKRICTFCLSFV